MTDSNSQNSKKTSISSDISIDVILLAAGRGERFQNSLRQFNLSNQKIKNLKVPKAFLSINKKPLYQYSVDLFSTVSDHIWLVIPKNQNIKNNTKYKSIYGGDTRYHSVLNALQAIATSVKKYPRKKEHWVLVHDCARVVFDQEDLNQLIKQMTNISKRSLQLSGLITAAKVTDSIKQISLNSNYQNLNRDYLFIAQTPQIFKFADLHHAYQSAKSNLNTNKLNSNPITDEASAIENLGLSYEILLTKKDNFKINNYCDFLLAKKLFKLNKTDE